MPLTLRHLSYLGTSLCILSSNHVAAWLFNQYPSDLHHLRSVYQQSAPFLEKVRRFQVRTIRRMLENVPMELFTQQGLCLPGSMRTCIVVQQNNSTREPASSATYPKISSACRKLITPLTSQSAGFSICIALAIAISALTT